MGSQNRGEQNSIEIGVPSYRKREVSDAVLGGIAVLDTMLETPSISAPLNEAIKHL